jgi:polysaccharide biosynthesis/export protein
VTSKKFNLALSIALLACSIPVCAQSNAVTKTTTQSSPDTTSTSAVKSATEDPNYLIGAQDILDISVWHEPDLTRVVPVRPDGKISLPLLNDVQAAGLTPTKLSEEITTGLKKFVTDPQVTVIVSAINSQRVYILGEVTRAGAYPLLPGMTVLQGLSSSGGFTAFAKVKNIYVLRTEGDKSTKLPFNYKDVIAGRHSEQNIVLKAGDTIVVP